MQNGKPSIEYLFDRVLNEFVALDIAETQVQEIENSIKNGGIHSPRLSGMPTAHGRKKEIGDLLVQRDDAERKRKQAHARYKKLRQRVIDIVDTVHDPVDQCILRERYIFFWPWKQIEATHGISHRTCMRRKDNAMRQLTDAFPEESQEFGPIEALF